MDVHRVLLSVCNAENVDAPRSDGQRFRQEVPERLQPTLPLDTRVDKISRCDALGREKKESRGSGNKNYRLVNDNFWADQSPPSSWFH